MDGSFNMVKTRVAPSPTGFPHIGTIYQALFDYAYAKKTKGKFILRIEDTDRERTVAGAEENIAESLSWFNLVPDESPWKEGNVGPYRQSERIPLYHQYAQQLIDKGYAYFAYYPKEQAGEKTYGNKIDIPSKNASTKFTEKPKTIEQMIKEKDWILRMKIPNDTTITIRDEIRGDINFNSNEITQQVLIKSDGFPTYHLASVVDDHLMGITHVVRGEEWLTSTPKHFLLYEYFEWEKPKFYHTPLLRNPDKSKLSKRHGHTNVDYYKNEGFLPEAILNFLALLGWSHPEEKEIFTMEEFISLLELEDIKSVAPIFDLKKLEWMNGMYIRELSNSELLQRLTHFDPDFIKSLGEIDVLRIIEISKTRIKTLKEFSFMVGKFLNYDPINFTDEEKKLRKKLIEVLNRLDIWTKENILRLIMDSFVQEGVDFKLIYKASIGTSNGLPLADMFEIIGKIKTIKLLS